MPAFHRGLHRTPLNAPGLARETAKRLLFIGIVRGKLMGITRLQRKSLIAIYKWTSGLTSTCME